MPVILFHAGFQTFSGGFVGVDIFFVISGYLITSLLISELETGRFSLVRFYERRARRILPALFLVLLFSIVVAWFRLPPGDMSSFSQSLAAVSLFASNILFWKQSGYFDTAAELKPLLHTWSLAVEEQFYVLFPLFLMALWNLNRKWLLGLLTILSLLSLGAAHWGTTHEPTATFYLLPTRGWELAIGAICAFYLTKENVKVYLPPAQDGMSAVGLILIVYSIFAYSKLTPFPSLYALVPTIGAALIILFAHPGNVTGRLLSNKAFVGIGLISYSAYLWHQPLFAFARMRSLEEPGRPLLATLVLMTLALAYVSWRFIESPFRQKSNVSRSGIFAFAAIGSLAFLGLGLIGYKTHGLKELRTTAKQKEVLATALSSPRRADCHTGGIEYRKPAQACEYEIKGGAWAVFGDSHGVELAYALAEELRKYHQGVRHFTFSGCPPSYQNKSKISGCAEWTDETVDYIVADSNIKNVVVSYRIHSALFGGHEGVFPKLPNEFSAHERELIWASYKKLLEQFVAAGKNVILVLQAPEIAKPVESLIMSQQYPVDIKGTSVHWWQQRSRFVNDRIGEIPSQVRIIRPEELFCDTDYCYAVKDGTALYFDDDHMSLAGAALVVGRILHSRGASTEAGESPTNAM